MTAESDIGRLVKRMICALVDQVDEVHIEELVHSEGSTIIVRVSESDVGKAIGKQGRTARSIRTILGAAGMKSKRRFSLDILES